MAIDPRKFLARFVEEAREHCGGITAGLLALEQNPGDTETLHALFRSAHTIKGSARMLKQMGVSGLAHHMEDVLDAVRSGRLSMSPALSDGLLKGVDALTAMLDALAGGGTPEAPEALCRELAHWLETDAEETPGAEAQSVAAPEVQPPANQGVTVPKVQTDYLRIDAVKLDGIIQLMGEIVSEHSRLRQQVQHLRGAERSLQRFAKSLDAWSARHGISESGQRELKMNLREQLQALRGPVRGIHDSTNLQEHLVGDLQEASLRMRMQPLSTIFEPLRRTVRDLAREHGKDVEFVVEGEGTELDRKIIEKLGDPLVHMLRNCIDHGLEGTEERSAAGKAPKGTIALSAAYEGGFVTISVRDDGRGLSAARIKEKALAKRLCDPESLAAMSRSEIHNLIFLPGLSTSAIITDLSGRGVGMDVVRKNVTDELRGTISIFTATSPPMPRRSARSNWPARWSSCRKGGRWRCRPHCAARRG